MKRSDTVYNIELCGGILESLSADVDIGLSIRSLLLKLSIRYAR